MTEQELAQLRLALGESIPVSGSEADTHFTDEELTNLFVAAGNDMTGATIQGWRLKAAMFADLVDMSELREEMKLSQLYDQAMEQVKYYSEVAASGDVVSMPATRLHKLSR